MSTQTRDSKTDKKQEQNSHQASEDESKKGVVSGIKREARPVKGFVTKFNNDWSMNLSAALAYNLMLSTVPIIIVLLSVLGLLLGVLGHGITDTVFQAITNILPAQVHPAQIIQGVKNNLRQSSGILGLIGVVSAIFFGSRLFVLLETFFSIIYRVRPRPLIRQNLMAIGMMLLFLILVPIMILASSVPPLAVSLLRNTPLGQIPLLASAAGFLGGVVASFLLFEAIYVIVPNLNIRLRHGWLGALVVAIALQFYLVLFPLYASNFLKGAAGAVGFTIVLLVFFYYFAVLLFLGAEINAFFAEGVRPMPNDLATFVSTMAGKLNEDIPSDEGEAHVNTRPTDQADKEHAVDFVKETSEKDVPQQVSEDKDVQEEVLRRRRGNVGDAGGERNEGDTGNKGDGGREGRSASDQQKTAANSQSKSTGIPNKPQEVSSPAFKQGIPKEGIVVGVVVGAVLSFLVEVLRLRNK